MHYEIIFVDEVPKQSIVIKNKRFIVYSKLSKQAMSDFVVLQKLLSSEHNVDENEN